MSNNKFKKAYRIIYRSTCKSMLKMRSGQPEGKTMMTQRCLRERIKSDLIEHLGLSKKAADDWSNRAYQRAHNWVVKVEKRHANMVFKDRMKKVYPGKSDHDIDIIFNTVYEKKKETRKLPSKNKADAISKSLEQQRRIERKKIIAANAHLRCSGHNRKRVS